MVLDSRVMGYGFVLCGTVVIARCGWFWGYGFWGVGRALCCLGLLAGDLVGLLLFVLLCFDCLAVLCDCELSNAPLPGILHLGGLFIWWC